MSENTLVGATFEGPTPYARQNVMARLVSYPGWMSTELKNTLQSLVERRVTGIENLYSGLNTGFNSEGVLDVVSAQVNNQVIISWPEFAGKAVQKTLTHWAQEAVKARALDPACDVGIGVLFIEPDATHNAVVTAWWGAQLFPEETGILEGSYRVEDDQQRPELPEFNAAVKLPSREGKHRIRFYGDILASDVDEATAKLADEVLKKIRVNPYIVESWQVGYGEVITKGDANLGDLEDVRSEVLQAMDQPQKAVIHFAVDDDDPDPAATVRHLMQEYGENNVHWAVHADKSTLPEDLQKLPVLMTASATPEHTPSIKAFEGSEQQADDEEWFSGAKAKMTDAQWEAFGAYDATLVAPLGYKDGTIVIGRGGCNISYVADYYKLMRKWFNENITDKGIPGNEAPEGWKS